MIKDYSITNNINCNMMTIDLRVLEEMMNKEGLSVYIKTNY
jgi:hypothetical protein